MNVFMILFNKSLAIPYLREVDIFCKQQFIYIYINIYIHLLVVKLFDNFYYKFQKSVKFPPAPLNAKIFGEVESKPVKTPLVPYLINLFFNVCGSIA